MLAFFTRRVAHALPVLLLSSVWVFLLLRVIPGDPATALAGQDASPSTLAAIRQQLGLDQPLPVQYASWIGHASLGDFGQSISSRRPVADLLSLALPATAELLVAAMLVAVLVGGGLGLLAAVCRRSWVDVLVGALNGLLLGVPGFWMGLLAIIVFALILGWVPPGGRVDPLQDLAGALRTVVLPALVLGLGQAAVVARFTRAAMLEVLTEAYVRTAYAKGLPGRVVVLRHALRNALIPVVTVISIQIGHLLGGAVVIETVFSWPGMGRLAVSAIGQRDYPVVQAVLLLSVTVFVLVNLSTDLLYGKLDPRVRVRS